MVAVDETRIGAKTPCGSTHEIRDVSELVDPSPLKFTPDTLNVYSTPGVRPLICLEVRLPRYASVKSTPFPSSMYRTYSKTSRVYAVRAAHVTPILVSEFPSASLVGALGVDGRGPRPILIVSLNSE